MLRPFINFGSFVRFSILHGVIYITTACNKFVNEKPTEVSTYAYLLTKSLLSPSLLLKLTLPVHLSFCSVLPFDTWQLAEKKKTCRGDSFADPVLSTLLYEACFVFKYKLLVNSFYFLLPFSDSEFSAVIVRVFSINNKNTYLNVYYFLEYTLLKQQYKFEKIAAL